MAGLISQQRVAAREHPKRIDRLQAIRARDEPRIVGAQADRYSTGQPLSRLCDGRAGAVEATMPGRRQAMGQPCELALVA